jgi:hypothetical protein
MVGSWILRSLKIVESRSCLHIISRTGHRVQRDGARTNDFRGGRLQEQKNWKRPPSHYGNFPKLQTAWRSLSPLIVIGASIFKPDGGHMTKDCGGM